MGFTVTTVTLSCAGHFRLPAIPNQALIPDGHLEIATSSDRAAAMHAPFAMYVPHHSSMTCFILYESQSLFGDERRGTMLNHVRAISNSRMPLSDSRLARRASKSARRCPLSPWIVRSGQRAMTSAMASRASVFSRMVCSLQYGGGGTAASAAASAAAAGALFSTGGV
jgi:hypothetical protein